LLRQLANLPTPDPAAARELARTLRERIDARSRLQGTDADQARHLAEIIDAALAFHQAHGDGDCPVCGRPGALDPDWHGKAAVESERLRKLAEEADAAENAVTSAMRAAGQLCPDSPTALESGAAFGIDTTAAAGLWR